MASRWTCWRASWCRTSSLGRTLRRTGAVPRPDTDPAMSLEREAAPWPTWTRSRMRTNLEVKPLRLVRWQLASAIAQARSGHAGSRALADKLETILGHVKRALGEGRPPRP